MPSLPRTPHPHPGNVPDAHLVDDQSDAQLANEAYSEGVRQLVWKYHRNRTGFRVVARSQSYAHDWSESQVGGAPPQHVICP